MARKTNLLYKSSQYFQPTQLQTFKKGLTTRGLSNVTEYYNTYIVRKQFLQFVQIFCKMIKRNVLGRILKYTGKKGINRMLSNTSV